MWLRAAGRDIEADLRYEETLLEQCVRAGALLTWVAEALDAPPCPEDALDLRARVAASLEDHGPEDYVSYFDLT